MVPVGTVLLHFKLIGEGFTRTDPFVADTGNPVHGVGQNNPVPMDRAVLIEIVCDMDSDLITLPPAECWSCKHFVDGSCKGRFPCYIDRDFVNA